MSTRRNEARRLVPETIQTSGMDCGPAALHSLLAGFGIPVSYGRLREACQTDVDGTSINALEASARALGLDVAQLMLPADHVALTSANAMPAIAVSVLPSGMPHFVVAWGRSGRFVQVMDPATGRRIVGASTLPRMLYIHEQPVPFAAWESFAQAPTFQDALRARLGALGLPKRAAAELVALAQDRGGRAMAALDAQARALTAAPIARRDRAPKLRRAVDEPGMARTEVAPEHWFARPVSEDDEPEEVMLRGAVLVRARGHAAQPPDLATMPPDLAAALTEPPPRPAQRLLDAARGAGRVAIAPLVLAIALLAAGAVAETSLLRGSLDASDVSRTLLIVAGLALVLGIVETMTAAAGLGIGRRLEVGLRRSLAQALPRLPDRYLRSRPPSDMAERAHHLHELRMLPLLATQMLAAALETLFVAAALCVLDPAGAPYVLLATFGALGVALLVQLPLREREMRAREHASALSQSTLDGVLGVLAIRAHGAEPALTSVHDERLAGWIGAARAAVRARSAATLLSTACGIGLAIPVVVAGLDHLDSPPERLLLVLWAITIPVAAERVGQIALQWPGLRTLALRLAEPLDAPAAAGADEVPPALPAEPRGAEVTFAGASVRASGQDVLAATTLEIGAGEHVALVGLSGAGKSTLLALALGLADASDGRVTADGVDLSGGGARALWPSVAWVDPQVRVWNRDLAHNIAPLADEERVRELVVAAELDGVAARVDGEPLGADGGLLSGGEAQRVRLARALARDGVRLAVLDEPLRGLDREQRHRLLGVARERWRDATLLCATHDVGEALSFDRVLVLEGGRVVADGPPDRLMALDDSPLRAMLETEAELRAELDGGRGWRRLRVAAGTLQERSSASRPLGSHDAGALHGNGRAPMPGAHARPPVAELSAPATPAAHAPEAGEHATAGVSASDERAHMVPEPDAAEVSAPATPATGVPAADDGDAAEVSAPAAPATGVPAADDGAVSDDPPQPQAGTPDAPAAPRPGHPAGSLSVFALATILRYTAFAASWSVIGAVILADGGSLTTWALLLAATVPLAGIAEAAEGRAAIALGARLRERTLRGALALEPSWVRREGPGRILGRSMEVDAIARLAAGGGLSAVTAVIELGVAAVALLLSAPGRTAAIPLALVLVASALLSAVSVQRRRAWTIARLAETDELLEAIAGQRTRLIQGDHEAAERALRLDDYARLGAAADRPLAVLSGSLPRVALAAGLAGLALGGKLSDPSDVALALGGVLLATQALRRIAAAVATLTSASLAHQALEPILAAAREARGTQTRIAPAARRATDAETPFAPEAAGKATDAQTPIAPEAAGRATDAQTPIAPEAARKASGAQTPIAPEAAREPDAAGASLAVRGLCVERGGREVLHDVDLDLHPGDRAVLSGASGAGKSTLAAAIAGLLATSDGSVSLGAASPADPTWRSRVGFVPQHGDNHVLLAPVAFNLLMGRAWPPSERDLEDAAAICEELGLGPLLARMPAGLGQVVGETGWRLSQGERARLCLGRALLADHDVLLLDEPLGALDPHTARTILDVVRRRARTLVVISQE